MAILHSYDLKGKKLSFANWISNLSPTETPFSSMTGKEVIDQTSYSWQTDRLSKAATNAVVEGSEATDAVLAPTSTVQNYTQIFRKVVRVTDTADKIATYGRTSELNYQMEKAGKELRRDVEATLLGNFTENDNGSAGSTTTPRYFKGFKSLVAAYDVPDTDTGAVTHFQSGNVGTITEDDIFKMTYNLYLAGSKADTIMVHPEDMFIFSKMIGGDSTVLDRKRMFDGLDTKLNTFVNSIKDPLGQTYQVVPNRYMPKGHMYFFTASDWTQMVLRAPEKAELAKTGSSTKYMIEMEIGLRHRNPYASGVLVVRKATAGSAEGLAAKVAPKAKAVKAKAE